MTRSVVRKSRSKRKVSEGPEIRRGSSTVLVALRADYLILPGGDLLAGTQRPTPQEREGDEW